MCINGQQTIEPIARCMLFRSVMLYSGLKKRDVPEDVFTLGFMSRVEELRKMKKWIAAEFFCWRPYHIFLGRGFLSILTNMKRRL